MERLPRLSGRMPSEGLLEDMNAAVETISTLTVAATNKLICATVILGVLGYKLNASKSPYRSTPDRTEGADCVKMP